jgi:predicted acylesterase/phospholipase RssA
VPGLYPPVKIDGQYYLDGGIRKTLHASTALDAGAELLICINPIVAFCPSAADPDQVGMYTSLFDGGFPMVFSQAARTLIHSRMKLGMAQYAVHYPDRQVILFEPDRGDARIFFSNIFSFSKRRMVCEHAYQTTREDLRARQNELEPLFAQYGLTFRKAILNQQRRRVSDCLRESLLRFEFATPADECADGLMDALHHTP